MVKDLSRFGRNYLEKIFPYLGVRFISVNDRFDTLHRGKANELLVPLKAIFHDNYAKDISIKICTSLDVKKKSGKFMEKIPPYGYMRDSQDRCHLVVHRERAKVVRRVFQWKLEGVGVGSIARKLNEEKIPTQLQIRFQEGYGDGRPDVLWRGSSVSDMLKNHCYLGCIVERKSSKALYQGRHTTPIPQEQWKLIPRACLKNHSCNLHIPLRGIFGPNSLNVAHYAAFIWPKSPTKWNAHLAESIFQTRSSTHEAIIEDDMFYKVQELMEESRGRRSAAHEGRTGVICYRVWPHMGIRSQRKRN